MADLRFYIFSNSISVLAERWRGMILKNSANEPLLRSKRFPLPAEIELGIVRFADSGRNRPAEDIIVTLEYRNDRSILSASFVIIIVFRLWTQVHKISTSRRAARPMSAVFRFQTSHINLTDTVHSTDSKERLSPPFLYGDTFPEINLGSVTHA